VFDGNLSNDGILIRKVIASATAFNTLKHGCIAAHIGDDVA
jgi:hypothetical protein